MEVKTGAVYTLFLSSGMLEDSLLQNSDINLLRSKIL